MINGIKKISYSLNIGKTTSPLFDKFNKHDILVSYSLFVKLIMLDL